MAKNYDQECWRLAEHFLQDEPCSDDPALMESHCNELAIWIQEAVENWFVTPPQIAKYRRG